MPQTLVCKTCSQPFETYRLTNAVPLYCSRKCADEGHRKNVEPRTCLHCQKQFSPKWESSKLKYCSRACNLAHRKAQINRVACETCGKVFETRSGKPNRYCSWACRKASPNEQVVKVCAVCGKEYSVIKSREHAAKYCSQVCANKLRIQRLAKDRYEQVYHKGKKVMRHRFVMEQYIGRELRPEENVHHKNGVRRDNRLENLELWSKAQPAGQRIEDKLAYARMILDLYDGYIAP